MRGTQKPVLNQITQNPPNFPHLPCNKLDNVVAYEHDINESWNKKRNAKQLYR
jgi:hypothetical protein